MLYLIRHGSTDQPMLRPPGDLTPATRAEWALDHGLSARGVEEARSLQTWLARLEPPDRVVSSPKRRTRETAALAAPGRDVAIDERLHEWHEEEPLEALLSRVRAWLANADEGVVWAFTHGGFVRAVIATLLTDRDDARFGPAFHDLRRTVHIWNGSITLVAHGASGLELYAVNHGPATGRLLGSD
jgi:broad specificity phosphatase PhoE